MITKVNILTNCHYKLLVLKQIDINLKSSNKFCIDKYPIPSKKNKFFQFRTIVCYGLSQMETASFFISFF